MNKKILIGCILAVVLIVLASLTSVVGNIVVKSNVEKKSVVSPLFAVRSHRFIKSEDIKKVSSNYFGKGKPLNLLFPTKAPFNDLINKALKIIENRPNILDIIIAGLEETPEIIDILEAHNIDINDFKNDIAQFKNDPSLLKEEYEEAVQVLGDQSDWPLDDPIAPLGLLDQWFPGALILALLLLPAFILVGLIVATILIITCIIPQCLEGVMKAVLTGLIQGLRQPVH